MSEHLIERDICLICSGRIEPLPALEIAGLSHGAPGHNVQYSRRALGVCPNCDHGQLECYAHDCWDHPADEDWDMYWWYHIIASHNAYHTGELAILRQLMGLWPENRASS